MIFAFYAKKLHKFRSIDYIWIYPDEGNKVEKNGNSLELVFFTSKIIRILFVLSIAFFGNAFGGLTERYELNAFNLKLLILFVVGKPCLLPSLPNVNAEASKYCLLRLNNFRAFRNYLVYVYTFFYGKNDTRLSTTSTTCKFTWGKHAPF